MIPEPKD